MNRPLITSIIVCIVAFSISCSSKDEPEPNPLGEIDAAFVGNWKGEIKGSLGVAEVTFSINDNGTINGIGFHVDGKLKGGVLGYLIIQIVPSLLMECYRSTVLTKKEQYTHYIYQISL